jgi:hypothetical protein
MWRAPALLRLISLLVALLCGGPLSAASRFDPRLRFRTLATDHFVIYFHPGQEHLAGRLARIAEETRGRLQATLGVPVQRRTHVVLVDQSEQANGWAAPTPYNTIAISAAAPSGSELIGFTEDWLRLVFAHEYAHILHLDRSHGWSRIVRAVFGRTPLAFPNLFLPVWQIEGLATLEESRVTSAGRLRAGDFRAIDREAARAGGFEPIDRVNGGLTSWPGGHAPYAYGAGFHEYLSGVYGEEKLTRLADATTRRVPYFTAGAFSSIFGKSLTALWEEYRIRLFESAPGHPVATGEQLTRHGFDVSGPRFLPRRCPACPWELVYSLRTPHAFPTLNTMTLDGSPPREITSRYLGDTSGVGHEVIVFDQQELRRTVGLYSDLYSVNPRTRDVTQLTDGERLVDPDLSPDGSTIVAVREGSGRRELVTVRLSGNQTVRLKPDTPHVVLSAPDTQFNAPRWSPDGRSIAVERHRLGAASEIVVVDAATAAVRMIASAPGTRHVTPAWRPDGRAVVVAAAPSDEPFNLYEIALDAAVPTRRQLTHTTGGATWPDISPDGATMVFVGYTVDGFELFSMPYPAATPGEPGPASTAASGAGPEPAGLQRGPLEPPASPMANGRSYNPLPTLLPTSWYPVVELDDDRVRIGAGIAGVDVLGYHTYSASATWRVDSPESTAGPAPLLDWRVAYAYDRWVPTIFTSATWETSFAGVDVDDTGGPLVVPVRSREIEAGVFVPFRRVRVSHQALASLVRSTDRFEFADRPLALDWTSARAGWATSSAKFFGFSISPEKGVTIGGTGEAVLEALGSPASASALTGDLRAYLPGARPHHVIALRAAGGASSGERGARRQFLLGGAAPAGSVLDFDADAISLLRGFEPNAFAGSRVALVNAEYRWPFARPERGYKTWPLFLHTAHAAVFADVGHAWSNQFDVANVKTSLGGELSADIVAGYVLRLTVTAGGAWGRDPQRRGDRATIYVRLGQAF